MIFVTLGTQDKPFKRLIKSVERQIELGNIKEEVIVQAGCTKYKSKYDNMKIINYMPIEEFNKYLDNAKLIITHAGVGTILKALGKDKIVIAAARKKFYGEHVNDHQEQILNNFTQSGYILPLRSFRKLNEVIEEAKKFKPQKFESNNINFTNSLEEEINNLLTM